MSEFDFSNAKLPKLAPLNASHAVGDVEAELKALSLDLWDRFLARKAFDLNVSGMAHLGSFEQVRKAFNADGLAMLASGSEEARTRYLYRAWMARAHRGRGLSFLRTYLQMLWPNACEVSQLWHEIGKPYPSALLTEEEVKKRGLENDVYLTSRVDIEIELSASPLSIGSLVNIIGATIPARFVPVFSKVVAHVNVEAARRVFYFEEESITIYPMGAVDINSAD